MAHMINISQTQSVHWQALHIPGSRLSSKGIGFRVFRVWGFRV